MMQARTSALALVVITVALLSPILRADQPFDNANFEKGDFTNWSVHDGWSLHGGIRTSYASQAVNHHRLYGDWTAWSGHGDWLAKRYTGKAPPTTADRLVSTPFEITKPWLTFFFAGSLAKDRHVVGVSLASVFA